MITAQKTCLGALRVLAVAFFAASASLSGPTTTQAAHIDPTVIATIPVDFRPHSVGVNSATDRVYVSQHNGNTVSVIDGATNTVMATVPVGDTPHGVGVNIATNRVYVGNRFSSDVSVIDGATNTVMATVPVGGGPEGVGVNPSTNRVYVANHSSNTVSVIDGATHTVMATVPVGSFPNGVGVNFATNRVYVANRSSSNVSVIDGATNTVMATVPVGFAPHGVGVNFATNRVYVANFSSNTVSVIDGATNTVMATVPVGFVPHGVGVNFATNRVYVANSSSSDVSVIDGATNTVMATVPVGSGPFGVGVNPSTDRVYVANSGSDTVSVIADIGGPATLVISPPADANPVATQHCVTATVQDAGGNPVSGVTVRFSVTGSVTTTGSATTNAAGQATFCYTGPMLVGADIITAYADTNNNTVQDGGEPSGVAAKAWVAAAPSMLTLTPPAAINTVDTQHCVIATLRDIFGNPIPGVTVRFSVTGSVMTGGSAATNASGQATFCYTGPALPGADAITAYADANTNNVQDAGEPTGAAAKAWVLPVTTPLCEIKISNGGRITALNGDKATFGGNARSSASGQTSGQETYQDHGPVQDMTVKSINVLAIVCEGTMQASIYGQATINDSGSFFYRINVEDVGEPGKGVDTYWIILQNGYDSGQQTLEGGNVQVHRTQ